MEFVGYQKVGFSLSHWKSGIGVGVGVPYWVLGLGVWELPV
jgi:hypothetical protein